MATTTSKMFTLTHEQILEVDKFLIHKELNHCANYIRTITNVIKTYPTSDNIHQDKRDKDIILDILERLSYYSNKDLNLYMSVREDKCNTCKICLIEPHYNLHTKNTRWYKKGEPNHKSPLNDVFGVRLAYAFMCNKCFYRISPYIATALTGLNLDWKEFNGFSPELSLGT